MKEKTIGVDMGTGGVKAGIVNDSGRIIAKTYEESNLIRPAPGRVEQDLDEIYASALRCIKQTVEKAHADPEDIAGIAVSSQMSGIGAIDKNWKPVMPFDSWLDTRCEPYIFEMLKTHGDEITRITGCPPTYAHGPKIIWWKNEAPEIYDKIYKFVAPYVYVGGKMADLDAEKAYIDPTCIHFTGFCNTKEKQWSERLLSEFGVKKGKLPRIVDSCSQIGTLSKEAAQATNLVQGIPILAGAGDQAAGALGAGIVEPGIAFDVSGTASVFSICARDFKPDVENKVVLAAPSVIEDQYYALSFINGGGMNLRWFRDEFAPQEKKADDDAYKLLDEVARKCPPGSNKLFFLPHVQGRVCPPQPSLRGLWLGFTWGHKRETFYRSILEAISYEYAYYLKIERELHPDLNVSEVRAIGGGSASELWNQMKADVLGLPYWTINRREVGILGDALIAGHGIGMFDGLRRTSKSFVSGVKKVQPRKERHDFYSEYTEFYSRLVENYTDVFKQLLELPSWNDEDKSY